MTTPDERKRAVGRLLAAPIGTNALSHDRLLSEQAELLAAVERMRGALKDFVDGIERAPISWETGCCCCGSPVDSHGFGDGHSPVDEGVYFITQLIKAARAALTTGEATTPNAGERG